MKKLEEQLKLMGLSPSESKVYIGLLKNGKTTILELSRQIKVNRTTTHVAVENLISKGLVNHIKNGAKRIITAEPPEMFKYLIEQEKNTTKIKEDELNDLVTNAYSVISNVKQKSQNEVRYYEGFDAVRRVYDDMLKSKEIRAYIHLDTLYKYFPENIAKFQKACKNGTIVRDLQTYDFLTDEMIKDNSSNVNYFYKNLPHEYAINSMDYTIFDDKITVIDVTEGNPTAIVITSAILAKNAKHLFDALWNLL